MRVEGGFCVTCEKPISQACPTCGARKFTGDKTEVEVQWSNGSKMKIGICNDCATKHIWASEEGKQGITQAHWDYWDKMGSAYDKGVIIV